METSCAALVSSLITSALSPPKLAAPLKSRPLAKSPRTFHAWPHSTRHVPTDESAIAVIAVSRPVVTKVKTRMECLINQGGAPVDR